MVRSQGRLHALARLIRVEHTLFSLPYAYLGGLLGGSMTLKELVLITLAVFGLRTAAMAYNNIADLDIDRLNPRSSKRPLVTGAASMRDAWLLVALGSILYYLSAALLNKYALMLSPILWIVAMTYPHAKRYHSFPHIHLGLTLGLVVFGGTIATYGDVAKSLYDALARVPWDLVVAVTCWVAGFDVIYSIMDVEFDRRLRLGSIPARYGERRALQASTVCHAVYLAILGLAIPRYGLGLVGIATYIVTAALIAYEQYIVYREGFEAIPRAFNTNLLVGVVVGIGYSLALIA